MTVPLVSICCITYNHEEYIRNAIEGFLMQEINFPIEIIIHDDASTDNTQQIIEEYAKSDDRIIPILRKENIKSTGVAVFPFTFEKAQGKYIALCEGDDYWTDPSKLQKQVEFLESHKDFVVTHHDAEVINSKGDLVKESQLSSDKKKISDASDLLKGEGMVTCSMVFRNIFTEQEIPFELNYAFGGDRFLTSILGLYGKACMLENVGKAKYRIHQGGIDGSFTMDAGLESELRKMENYLSTRIAIYLFLKRKGKKERYSILLNDILPRLLQMYKKKYGNSYFIEKVKKKLNIF